MPTSRARRRLRRPVAAHALRRSLVLLTCRHRSRMATTPSRSTTSRRVLRVRSSLICSSPLCRSQPRLSRLPSSLSRRSRTCHSLSCLGRTQRRSLHPRSRPASSRRSASVISAPRVAVRLPVFRRTPLRLLSTTARRPRRSRRPRLRLARRHLPTRPLPTRLLKQRPTRSRSRHRHRQLRRLQRPHLQLPLPLPLHQRRWARR